MTIVPIGKLILQVPDENHPGFVAELCAAIQGQIRQVVGRCLEEVLEAELDRKLGRRRYVRRRRAKRQEVQPYCSRCRTHQRRNFQRNGHYPRYLDTHWGGIRIGVPQVKCVCGGNVKLTFQTLRPRQRWWDDLELEVRLDYGRGLSYRQIKAELNERLGHSVGLRTLNRQVLDAVGQQKPTPGFEVGEAPPVVRLDGIWITVMFPTGEVRKDRLGRLRHVKQARKVPILAAQGVWPASGRTRLLAWTRAEGEDTFSWEQFLEQLDALGINSDNGLALLVGDGSPGLWAAYQNRYWMVPMQRCVFHKLRNIAGAFHPPAGVDGKTARQLRRQFLRRASRIWQAEDECEARDRYNRFCQQWCTAQPQAITTLARDFEETLTFYSAQLQAAERGELWPSHLLRTTSQLERSFRTFRRRYRSAVLFHSVQGADAVTTSIAVGFS